MRISAALLLVSSVALAQSDREERGQGERVRAELSAPETLRAGDRAALELRVSAPADMPVMVTPRSEGAAVEVVRGRLLRPDAVDPDTDPLVFRIPIVAREPGPARVEVHVETYVCDDECRPARSRAHVDLRVARPD